MRAFRPRGLQIWRTQFKDRPFVCTIKSRGRTGAAIRSRLMAMTPHQQQPVLAEWALGRAANFPPARAIPPEPSAPPSILKRGRPPRALRRSKKSQAWLAKRAADREAREIARCLRSKGTKK